MNLKHTIKTALRAIMGHKSRSLLTILGIVIGVSSVIIVMSLGDGAQSLILNQISGLGPETVIVRPGTGLADITNVFYSQSLTPRDVDELKKKSNVPNLFDIAPFSVIPGSIEFEGKKYSPTIFGGPVEFFAGVYDLHPGEGDFYDETEINQRKRVAVIGRDLRYELFENRNAIGENIEILGRKFEIVGVFPTVRSVAGFNFDKTVMVPHTTATDITGANHYSEIIIRADSVENVDKMVADIKETLRDNHDIGFGEEDDFNVQTQEELVDQIQSIVNILTAFLVAVVAISLVVGGVGIMNIMLVSVTERTKEIGLRKALGAKSSDILNQFLLEAVVLTGLGGVLGIAIGSGISFVAATVLSRTVDPNWIFTVPPSAIFIGVGMSVLVGLIFGTYPAMQAARKSPIEALHYE